MTPGIAKTTGSPVALLFIVTEGQTTVVLDHIGSTKGIMSVNEGMVIITLYSLPLRLNPQEDCKSPSLFMPCSQRLQLVLRSAKEVGRKVATAETPHFWMEDFASIQTGGANARHCSVITFAYIFGPAAWKSFKIRCPALTKDGIISHYRNVSG